MNIKANNTKDLDFDNLEINSLSKHDSINSKFQILKTKLNENDKIRKLNQIRKILMNSKKINKKNKIIRDYGTRPPTPAKIKRKYKSEVVKLKEIYENFDSEISYPRKTRNNPPNRYGFSNNF